MHVLMISDVYFPRVNGVSTSIQTFARAFVALGHQVTLIAPDYPETHDAEFEVIRVASWRVPLDPEDRLMRLSKIKALVPELKTRSFDILHIQTPFVAHYAGLHLAKQLQLKAVVSYHTFFEGYFEKYLPWLPRRWLRGLARSFSRRQCDQVQGIVSPSTQMLKKLREYGANGQARVIPTGLPLQQFCVPATTGFRERYGIPDDAFVMLYLGRVAHEKNIRFLVDAFAVVMRRVRRAVLLIAGEGPAEESLNQMVNRMQLDQHVCFAGYLKAPHEVVACYRASDVFVFASETETQGLVLLEAMACGLPVISTASLGSQDVLKEGQGCHISPLDTLMFAEQVVLLANNPVAAGRLGAKGKAYAQQWSAEQKAQDMLAFYEQIRSQDGPDDNPSALLNKACARAGE